MSFNLNLDSINIITGKSGSGKSTLINLIMGLIPRKIEFLKSIIYLLKLLITLIGLR